MTLKESKKGRVAISFRCLKCKKEVQRRFNSIDEVNPQDIIDAMRLPCPLCGYKNK